MNECNNHAEEVVLKVIFIKMIQTEVSFLKIPKFRIDGIHYSKTFK